MLDEVVRAELMKMLGWHAGVQTGFLMQPGQARQIPQRCLAPEWWDLLRATYAGAEHTWDALFAMGELFRMAAWASQITSASTTRRATTTA